MPQELAAVLEETAAHEAAAVAQAAAAERMRCIVRFTSLLQVRVGCVPRPRTRAPGGRAAAGRHVRGPGAASRSSAC